MSFARLHARRRGAPRGTIRVVHALVLASTLAGCAPAWNAFAFRYGSNYHLPPAQRLIQVSASPKQVAAFLRKEIVQGGGKLIRDEKGVSRTYAAPESGDVAWQASRRIAEQEWQAIRAADKKTYDAIDRSSDKLMGTRDGDMQIDHGKTTTGIELEAEVWPRPARSARDLVETTAGITQTRANVRTFSTRISFYIWSDVDKTSQSNVYVTAIPVSEGIAGGDGRDLPLEWLPYSTGEQDASVVRNYLKLLGKVDGKSKMKQASK